MIFYFVLIVTDLETKLCHLKAQQIYNFFMSIELEKVMSKRFDTIDELSEYFVNKENLLNLWNTGHKYQ